MSYHNLITIIYTRNCVTMKIWSGTISYTLSSLSLHTDISMTWCIFHYCYYYIILFIHHGRLSIYRYCVYCVCCCELYVLMISKKLGMLFVICFVMWCDVIILNLMIIIIHSVIGVTNTWYNSCIDNIEAFLWVML